MKVAHIIQQIAVKWLADPVLSQYALRSTTIPGGFSQPYAIISAKHTGHEFESASCLGYYDVTISVYCPQDKSVAEAISMRLAGLIDFSTLIFTNAITVSVFPDSEDVDTDPDTNLIGQDVNVVSQKWNITLQEEYS